MPSQPSWRYFVVTSNACGVVTNGPATVLVEQWVNLALLSAGATAVANSEFAGNGYFPAVNVIDGNPGTFWGAVQGVILGL